MSQLNLHPIQQRVKNLAENIVLKDKIERRVMLDEIIQIVQQFTVAEQTQLIMSIEMAPALRFLAATGIRGSARTVLFARIVALEKEMKR
ncbi:MAG: hypothetical protein ACRD5H_16750 [Nitrososphaerales archaeon]